MELLRAAQQSTHTEFKASVEHQTPFVWYFVFHSSTSSGSFSPVWMLWHSSVYVCVLVCLCGLLWAMLRGKWWWVWAFKQMYEIYALIYLFNLHETWISRNINHTISNSANEEFKWIRCNLVAPRQHFRAPAISFLFRLKRNSTNSHRLRSGRGQLNWLDWHTEWLPIRI